MNTHPPSNGNGGSLVANPFGSMTEHRPSDALAVSEESKAIAEIQSMLVIAKKFPRDVIKATDNILRECSRPTLAEVSLYSYSRGGTQITGPSIRLAEAIARGWGNVEFGFREVGRGVGQDGVTYSEVVAYAWDLESNTRRPLSFRVRHWRDTRKGGYALVDERDIYELTANQAQRRVRACILGVVPGDVVEAAQQQCEKTLHANADTSPEGIKKMLSRFAEIGVTKDQIETRIQRRIDTIQPAQVIQLRNTYNSIRDGMSTPADWFETNGGSTQPSGGGRGGAEPAGDARPALPPYPDAQLETNLPKWRDMIEAGQKTADQILAMVSSKYQLADAQLARIRSLGDEPPNAEIPPAEAGVGGGDDNAEWLDSYDAANAARDNQED